MTTTIRERRDLQQVFARYLVRINEDKVSTSIVAQSLVMTFWQKYPSATQAGWVRFNKYIYGVFFRDRIWYKFARFSAEGDWIDTRVFAATRLLKPELVSAISHVLGAAFEVVGCETVVSSEGPHYYDVLVKHKGETIHLRLDKLYKVMSKLSVDPSSSIVTGTPRTFAAMDEQDNETNNDPDIDPTVSLAEVAEFEDEEMEGQEEEMPDYE